MTRTLLAIAAVVMACACTGTSDKRLQAIRNEADQELRRGNFDAAQRVVERGLAAAPADSAWAWTFKLSQAEILVERRQDAEALLSAALPAGPAFDPLRSRQKTLAAQNLLLSGQPRKALPLLAEASTLAPDGSELQLEIRLLEGQAKLRVEQNEQTLKTAIDQAAARGDTFRQARGWNNLGLGKYNAGRWDEAALQFERALAFTDLTPMTVYATALNNAGMCYARLGDFDRAVAVQERAVKFYSTHGRVSSYADALGELANTYIQMGEPEQAVPLYRQALTVAKDADLTVAAARNAGNLAAANVALGRWDEAERSNEEARRLKTLAKASGLVHNQLNAAQIALGRGQLDLAARLFDSALTDPTADVGVRWYAHEGLANVALAQSNPSKAGTHFESALQLIESAQSGLLKVEFQVSFLTRLIRFYQTYVDALINQGRIERALEVADSSRGRVLAARSSWKEPRTTTAAELRRIARDSRAVLLSYWLTRSRSYVWIVTADGIRGATLPAAERIAALVKEYKDQLSKGFADPAKLPGSPGERLYDELVKPAARWIPADSRVIVVADGALHGLNFETLVVPGPSPHYWIKDVEIEVAPGLSILSGRRGGNAAARSLLVMGDAEARLTDFPALKYAGPEVTSVSKHFPAAATIYTGAKASPAAYKASGPQQFSYVHFTAHAITNWDSPLDSAVILSGPDNAFKLYARDVAEVPLNAELVTVSACRGAGERVYSGEGLIGFAWAFLRAGARQVIAGLWDVDDRSTAMLMDRLYRDMAAGRRPAQALRAAKLALMDDGGNYGKPYYWGPFQVFTAVP